MLGFWYGCTTGLPLLASATTVLLPLVRRSEKQGREEIRQDTKKERLRFATVCYFWKPNLTGLHFYTWATVLEYCKMELCSNLPLVEQDSFTSRITVNARSPVISRNLPAPWYNPA